MTVMDLKTILDEAIEEGWEDATIIFVGPESTEGLEYVWSPSLKSNTVTIELKESEELSR